MFQWRIKKFRAKIEKEISQAISNLRKNNFSVGIDVTEYPESSRGKGSVALSKGKVACTKLLFN